MSIQDYLQIRYAIESRRKGTELWFASSGDFNDLNAAREMFYTFVNNVNAYEYRIVKLTTNLEVIDNPDKVHTP